MLSDFFIYQQRDITHKKSLLCSECRSQVFHYCINTLTVRFKMQPIIKIIHKQLLYKNLFVSEWISVWCKMCWFLDAMAAHWLTVISKLWKIRGNNTYVNCNFRWNTGRKNANKTLYYTCVDLTNQQASQPAQQRELEKVIEQCATVQ